MPKMNNIFAWISNYTIFGIIPLDWFLHFFLGAFISIILLRKGWSLWKVFIIVFAIAMTKESYDYFFHLPKVMMEFISDLLFSMSYLFLILFTRQIKRMLIAREKKIEKSKIES